MARHSFCLRFLFRAKTALYWFSMIKEFKIVMTGIHAFHKGDLSFDNLDFSLGADFYNADFFLGLDVLCPDDAEKGMA